MSVETSPLPLERNALLGARSKRLEFGWLGAGQVLEPGRLGSGQVLELANGILECAPDGVAPHAASASRHPPSYMIGTSRKNATQATNVTGIRPLHDILTTTLPSRTPTPQIQHTHTLRAPTKD